MSPRDPRRHPEEIEPPQISPTRPPPPPPPGREPAPTIPDDEPDERRPTIPPPNAPHQRGKRRPPPDPEPIVIKDGRPRAISDKPPAQWHGGSGLAACGYLSVEIVR